MKPTPEQVEAAKAWMKDSCSVQQYRVIREYKPMLESLGDVSDNVSLILLAALEAAEADGVRLDWLEARKGLRPGNCDRDAQSYYILHIPSGYDYYKGGKNLPLREAIDAARKEDRT